MSADLIRRFGESVDRLSKSVRMLAEKLESVSRLSTYASEVDKAIREIRFVQLLSIDDVVALSRLLESFSSLGMNAIATRRGTWFVNYASVQKQYVVDFGEAPLNTVLMLLSPSQGIIRVNYITAMTARITIGSTEPRIVESTGMARADMNIHLKVLTQPEPMTLDIPLYGPVTMPMAYDIVNFALNEKLVDTAIGTINIFADELATEIKDQLEHKIQEYNAVYTRVKQLTEKLTNELRKIKTLNQLEEL